jgi:C4-dicarboxylate-specific signal transduction histidine kinase
LKETTEELRVSNVKLEEYSQTLEQKVEDRTKELKEKNDELVKTLERLQQMQQQLVTQEKLASLGALTAGIAHEIKNPLNFVNNFSALSVDLTKELQEEVDKQKDRLDADTLDNLQAVIGDLQMNVEKINQHGKRADSIVRGMLMHSRGKPGERHPTDLNARARFDVQHQHRERLRQDDRRHERRAARFEPSVSQHRQQRLLCDA